MKTAHLDYETRSGADVTDVGAHRHAIDPRFEILMAGVSDDEPGSPVHLWINPRFATPDLMGDNAEAKALLASADIIYAHNAPFEQAATWGAFEQRKRTPFAAMSRMDQWRCTAAMARKAGLPFSLQQLSETLGLQDPKDRAGKALIKFFCVPDEDTGAFNEPRDHPEKWSAFCEYCRQDVRAEKEVGRKLKAFELTGSALQTFQFDLRMNQRGIPINLTAARNAQTIIDETQSGVVEEFRKLTGLNPTQGKKFKVWLKEKAKLDLPNLQAPTVESNIADLRVQVVEAQEIGALGFADTLAHRKWILELYQLVSYAAVKKVQTMLDCVCPDGRVRGAHMYYGAGTGRWSGKLLQPQNFKKTDPEFRPMIDGIYDALCKGWSAELVGQVYAPPLESIANCIRNFIQPPEGEILDGDFAQVEARIICWLAGQDDVLEKWRQGEDLYKWMASHVYGIPITEVTADQREVGKRIILGAGFQMGWRKFIKSCHDLYQLDVPKDVAKKGIKLFRALCKKIRDYWWMLNNSALQTLETKQSCGIFSVRKLAGIPYLLVQLKSGRSLAYPYPEVNLVQWVPEEDDDDENEHRYDTVDKDWKPREPEVKWRKEITYWGQIPMSAQWGRVKIYGGKFAENITQATAADFMAHGAIVAESRGMAPFMLVHDQGLALRTNHQTPEEYEAALGDLPPWAKGFPMKVEAKIAPWYRK